MQIEAMGMAAVWPVFGFCKSAESRTKANGSGSSASVGFTGFLVALCIASQTAWAQGSGVVLVTNCGQLFFALTNSSVEDVHLLNDMNMEATRALWDATGGKILRTSNITIRGSPQPGNPYYPKLDLGYMSDLIGLSPGASLNMFNMTMARYSLGTCGPDIVAISPGAYMHHEDVLVQSFAAQSYSAAVNMSARPMWAPGVNVFRNLTDGLCLAPDPCKRAYTLVDYACEKGKPSDQAIRVTAADVVLSMDVVLDAHCNSTAEPLPNACSQRLLNALDAQDRVAHPIPVTVWARSARELVTAMVNSTVDLVIITQDIYNWSDAQPLLDSMQLPVLRSRNITIQGAALPGVYPVVNFQFMKPFLRMAKDSSVILEQLVVAGLQVLPDPRAVILAAIEWAAAGWDHLILRDCLYFYYVCPTSQSMTSQLDSAIQNFLAAASGSGSGVHTPLDSPLCTQQPTTPQPSQSDGPSLDAFPPSSFTKCRSPAWAMQDVVLIGLTPTNSNRAAQSILFHNSWIACGEVMDASCQQQWDRGNSTCVANRVAFLQATYTSSLTPDGDSPKPASHTDNESDAHPDVGLGLGLGLGLGGAFLIGLVALLLALRARNQKRKQANNVESGIAATVYVGVGKEAPEACNTADRTAYKSLPTSSLLSTGDMDQSSLQAVLLELAHQTCVQPGDEWAQSFTKGMPLVTDLSLAVDVTQDVVLQHVIGMGTHGIVHQGLYKGQPVALKLFPISATDNTLAQELDILSRLHNTHIVTLLGVGCNDTHVFLILELCHSSLDKLLHNNADVILAAPPLSDCMTLPTEPGVGRQLPLPVVLSLAIQIARGLAYLHPTVVHRDLKPSNILLNVHVKATTSSDIDLTVKLSDFGLSRMMASVVLMTETPATGTVPYMAPECFKTGVQGLTSKCDIYSLGVILWELVHGQQPWHGLEASMILFIVVVQHQRPPFTASEDRCPAELRELIERCWSADPASRPSANDVVNELELLARWLPVHGPSS